MDKRWQKTCSWTGLDECPKAAQSKLVDLIEKIPKDQNKHELNILVVGKHGVGKSSLIKSIVGQDFLEKGGKVLAGREEIDLLRTPSAEELLRHNPRGVILNNNIFEYAFVSEDHGFTLKFFYAPWLVDANDMNYLFLRRLTRYPSEKHIDVLLYVDRADVYRVADVDFMIVMLVTQLFGAPIWKKALIVLTHSDAVDNFEDEDFMRRRKEELLSWMGAGGWIDKDLLPSLVYNAVLVDNTKIYKTEEAICDDNLCSLIQRIFDIAMDSEKPHVQLRLLKKWVELEDLEDLREDLEDLHEDEDLEDLHMEIVQRCMEDYLKLIELDCSNKITSQGKRQRSYPTSSDADVSDSSYCSGSVAEFLNNLPKERPNFSILVMGKSGVGKSSIINRIIGKDVIPISTFKGARNVSVRDVSFGNSTLRIMETPEFLHFGYPHPNFFKAVRWFQSSHGIDALIYVDRLDEYKWDRSRTHTLMYIAQVFGPSIMSSLLIVLTHCKSISGEQEELIATKLSNDIKYEILTAASPDIKNAKRLFKVAEVKTIVVENGGKHGKNDRDQCGWVTDLLKKLLASRIDKSLWDNCNWNPWWLEWDCSEGAREFLFDLTSLPESVVEEHNAKKSRIDLPGEAQEVS